MSFRKLCIRTATLDETGEDALGGVLYPGYIYLVTFSHWEASFQLFTVDSLLVIIIIRCLPMGGISCFWSSYYYYSYYYYSSSSSLFQIAITFTRIKLSSCGLQGTCYRCGRFFWQEIFFLAVAPPRWERFLRRTGCPLVEVKRITLELSAWIYIFPEDLSSA